MITPFNNQLILLISATKIKLIEKLVNLLARIYQDYKIKKHKSKLYFQFVEDGCKDKWHRKFIKAL